MTCLSWLWVGLALGYPLGYWAAKSNWKRHGKP